MPLTPTEKKSRSLSKKKRRKGEQRTYQHAERRREISPYSDLTCVHSNGRDMSFTKKEITYFDKCANLYNLANFLTNEEIQAAQVSKCLNLYFRANFEIVQGNSEEGKKFVDRGLEVAKTTQKNDFYTLLLASPLARVHYMENDIDALRDLIKHCFTIIERYGVNGVPGSILGWLYYMRARSNINDRSAAIHDYELAVDAFNLSNTVDKDFGKAHALCRLIICKLGCGEAAESIDHFVTPAPPQMQEVRKHFQTLKEMVVTGQNIVIRILFLMATSDFQFRQRKYESILKSTKEAHQLAIDHRCDEFLEVTKERINVYTEKLSEMSVDNPATAPTRLQTILIESTFHAPTSIHIGDKNISIQNQRELPAAMEMASMLKEQSPSTTQPQSNDQFQQEVTNPRSAVEQKSSGEDISRPLDYNVSEKMKSQIRSGDFVDFGWLLYDSKSQEDTSDTTLRLEPSQIISIEKWNEAFRIFVAIYSVEFPKQTPHLMKYSSIINDLATKNGDWQFYDLQFRKSNASGDLCWGELKSELYNSALTRNKK